MRALRVAAPLIVVVLICLSGGRPSAQRSRAEALAEGGRSRAEAGEGGRSHAEALGEGGPFSVLPMLDRYAAGEFNAVVADLGTFPETDKAFAELLKQLKHDGPGWIDAAGPAARERRELAAATFALEAARVDEWNEWKWIAVQPSVWGIQPPPVLWWKPPPLLIEWGCERFRRDKTPRPIERLWQLAALSVAQRSEDFEFLIGNQWEDRSNPGDQIAHLDHVILRFPHEMRFGLAQGIAVEWKQPRAAMDAIADFKNDIDVGGEATMRLGSLTLRQRKYGDAVSLFERAETMTRDPYVIFLSRYFKGQALERRLRTTDAERAYRGALAAVPGAESASVALSTLLFRRGNRLEAQRVAGQWLAARPQAVDPWREYAHADDRFWPELIGRLRAEIKR